MSTIFKSDRWEAERAGDLYYFTGKPCKHGHLAKRFVSCAVCIECAKVSAELNKEKTRLRVGTYNKKYPEKAKVRSLKWRSKNTHKVNAMAAKRRASKLKASPPWLTAEHTAQIEAKFSESNRRSKQTGVPHHVDHIVPLQGETVSGLHVPWNLQVIPASVNLSKHNKFNGGLEV